MDEGHGSLTAREEEQAMSDGPQRVDAKCCGNCVHSCWLCHSWWHDYGSSGTSERLYCCRGLQGKFKDSRNEKLDGRRVGETDVCEHFGGKP